MECCHLAIQKRLQNQTSITIQKNRAILKSVLKVIIFCGKQNISLRGSCEAISPVSFSQFAINPGSFQALLQFRIVSGDEVMKDHFSAGRKNAVFCSPKIQNYIIAAVEKWIQQKQSKKSKPQNCSHFVLMREGCS